MILEFGQAFALGYLHTDLMLLLCEARAFTVEEELHTHTHTHR